MKCNRFSPAVAVIITAMALLIGAPAFADYACFSACVQGGRATPGTCLQNCGYTQTTDYRCVQTCVATKPGGAAGSCLSQCSFYPDDVATPAHPDLASPHNQFIAPLPTGTTVFMAPTALSTPAETPRSMLSPRVQPLSPSTNYKLLQQCLQMKYTLSYCVVASRY